MSQWSVEAWEIPGASPFQRRVMDVPGVLEFTQPASGVGRCELKIPEDWGRLDEILDPDNDVGSLLRLIQTDRSGDPQIKAEYVLRRTATPRKDAGNIVTLTAPSIEDALEWAVVYPHDWPPPVVDPNWTWGFQSLLSTQNQGFEDNPYSLINPGAEDGTTNGWPTTGTRAEQIAPETFEAIENAGDADDGDWYFNITADTGEGVFQSFNKPLVEGETYIVSCRLFVATGETTRMEVTSAASVSVGSLFNGAAFADAVGNDAYQTVTVTFVAGAAAGGVSVLSQTDGNTFRLDKVRVEGFGVGTDDWSIRGTVDVFAVVPSTTIPAPPVDSGTFSLAWHPNSGVSGNDSLFLSQDTIPGQEVTGEIKVYHTEGANKDFRIVLRIPGVNPNTQNVASEVFSVPTATWTLLSATGIATTDTTELELRYDETGAPGSNIYVDTADFYTGQAPATIGVMGLQLLADAQTDHSGEAGDLARATLLWLKADWTATLDSAGNAWRAEESLTIVRGKTYGKVLSDDFAKLGYEYRVKPNPDFGSPDSESHILQIFNPANLTTRVGGASNDLVASVGFSGGNVVKGPVVKTPKSRNVTLAEGDALQFAVAKDAAGVTAWGARELYLAESGVLDSSSLAQAAANAITERGAAITATRLSIVDDGVFSPYIDFEPGDWVRGELPPDLPRGNHRVVAITGIIKETAAMFDIDIGAQVFVGTSGMNEAVSRLLSKFEGIDTPVTSTAAAATPPDPFTGPIEVTYLVAASDARSEIRALADFVCDGVADEEEINAAIDAVNALSNGGIVQLTEGTFLCADQITSASNLVSIWLRGAGQSTQVGTSGDAPSVRDGLINLVAFNASVTDMLVGVDHDKYQTAILVDSRDAAGVLERVKAYLASPSSTDIATAISVNNDFAVDDVEVLAGNKGDGIQVGGAGGRITINNAKVFAATTDGTGSGYGILIGTTNVHNVRVTNSYLTSCATAGIFVGSDDCIIIGNDSEDGIIVGADADGTILGGNRGTITNNGTLTRIFDENGFFNGTFAELVSVVVTEAAGTVTMSLEKSGGGSLTMRFADGQSLLETDPALTIALTTGTDPAPTTNYIYIPQATKVLTKSTSGFPTSAEHIKVAYFVVPTAAFVAARGTVVHQNWNDENVGDSGQGHMADITERQRRDMALWFKGVEGAGVDDYLTIVGNTIDLKSASGLIYQLYLHTYPAFDTSAGGIALVKNWSGIEGAFHDITNLFDIVDDSTGSTIVNNQYFNLVLWGVANETGTYHPMVINLPSGTYPSQAAAEADMSGFDDFTIPREFSVDSSTGFLIARLTVQKKPSTWEYKSTTDLRGTMPQTASGGAAGVTTSFLDSQFEVVNVADVTKILQLDLSSVTTGNTRTLIVPDADGTIALEGAATDADAIHDNVASEISAITPKGTPIDGDFLIIEDSAAANVKKSITVGDLPAADHATPIATHAAITTAHHTKYTDAEVDTIVATHAAITTAHHTKYTDAEAAAKIAADDLYVQTAGDTMGGALNMGNQTLLASLDPTLGTHIGDRDYNDGRYDAAGTAASQDHDHTTPIATHAALPNAHHNESHTIVSHSDTTATGAELETLTDGSETALHSHAGAAGGAAFSELMLIGA